MNENADLRDIIRELEQIDLSLKNGISAIRVIAQELDEQDDGHDEGPALYFIVEGLEVQQKKVSTIINKAMKKRSAGPGPKLVDNGGEP